MDAPTPSTPSSFRADIEGLRGVAVALVVLFHAGVPWLAGGYIGVDVFFVLSGYLITSLLIAAQRRGSIGLAGFYARRIRRLLPASTLVLVVSYVAASWWLPMSLTADLRRQAASVVLFIPNILFAVESTNYLNADVESPFQQYWSLAVEEQFYLVWPVLLVAVGAVALRRRWSLERSLAVVIGVVSVASFAVAVYWTATRQPLAFFLLPARAWELLAGAAWALAVSRGAAVPERLRRPLGWTGLIGIVAVGAWYGAGTSFPGVAAALPVAFTLAVIASEDTLAVLKGPIMGALGRYSYSIYLWHWPVLIIAAGASATPLSWAQRAGLVALSVALSVLTFHTVERPLRFSKVLSARSLNSAAFGVALIALAMTVVWGAPQPAPPEPGSGTGRAPVPDGEVSPFVPDGLRPPLSGALDDGTPVVEDGCSLSFGETVTPTPCRYGSGPTTVALLGDSHALHWVPTLEAAAADEDWTFLVRTKVSCPAPDIRTFSDPNVGSRNDDCNEWRDATLAELEADPPDVIITGARSPYYVEQVGMDEWLAGIERTVTRLSERSTVVVLGPTPAAERGIPACLELNLESTSNCAPTPAEPGLISAERAAVEAAGGTYVEAGERVCAQEPCPVVLGDVLLYRDANHLSATYAATLSTWLSDAISAAR